MFIFFLVRWLKFKLFWFFLLALCVGKNQMGLNVRWAVALLLTGMHMLCGGLQKTNLSVNYDLYLKLKYSFS